jgi:NADPH:quinone reductase-like Zn-dependent oxidoreductase
MRALICRGVNTPEVEVVEVEDPTPEDNEVVVDVEAVAVNRGELRLLSSRDAGWRPGQDVAGVVSVEAADGSGPPQGSRVVAWPEQAGWAEKVAVPTSHVAAIADEVTFSQAASLPIAGMTALRALRIGGNLEGKSVLVTGASGGVGRFAVELAANDGARVVAVASGPERAEGLTNLGAAEVVNDIAAANGQFDLILESVGGESLETAIALVAARGTVVVFGNSSNTEAKLSFADFVGKPGARIEAFFVYASGEPPPFGEDLGLLADLVARGSLHPQIGLEVIWTDANEAFQALHNREVNGKTVLLVG